MSEWVCAPPSRRGVVLWHPAGWETPDPASDPAAHDALEALALMPVPPPVFRPNLNVVIVPSSEDFAAFTAEQVRGLHAELDEVRLIDSAPAMLLDRDGHRVTVAHTTDAVLLTLQQWWTFTPVGAVILSATCDTFDFPMLADVFDEAAARLGWEEP